MEENKKSSKMPIIILVAILVVLLVGGIVCITINNKPKKIFTKAINSYLNELEETETEDIKTMNVTMGLGVNINSEDEEIAKDAEYINKAKFTVNAQMDLEQEKELVKLGVDYDNDKVLDAKISYKNQENNIYAKVEDLFDKTFSIEVDSEMKEQFKTIFEEVKDLAIGKKENSKKIVEILKDSISSRLKDEYFLQENVEVDVEGKTVNTKKSILTLTPVQLQEVLSGIVKDLKDNEEFINCFKDENKEEIKNSLNELETSVNEMTSNMTEEEKNATIKLNLYTKGLNQEFVKFEMVVTDNVDEYVISVLKVDTENYKLVATQKVDGATSEVLNSTVTIKNVSDTAKDITVKLNVEDLGEVTVNLQLSYVVNQPIEDIDTSNSVNIEELTEEDQEKIMTNLQGMKIYTIVQDIIGAYTSNMYSNYNY